MWDFFVLAGVDLMGFRKGKRASKTHINFWKVLKNPYNRPPVNFNVQEFFWLESLVDLSAVNLSKENIRFKVLD